MNFVYQHGTDVPENAPEGAEIKVYFDRHTAAQTMFQIIIAEQTKDQPLKLTFLFNSARYGEKRGRVLPDLPQGDGGSSCW